VGNLIRTERPNGTSQNYEYDELNQIVCQENTDSAGTVLASYRYTYDDAGNKTSVEEHTGYRVEYTYDELYHLTQETITDPVEGDLTIAYTFDAVGNRLTKDDSVEGLTIYSYDQNDRLLTETTAGVTTTYTYDDNGNLVSEISSEQQTTYTWNSENRLIGAEITDANGIQQIEYTYDADGIRVAKTVDGNETRYLIDANHQYAQVLEEYDATTSTEVSYVYGCDELIAQTREGDSRFYPYDSHSGTRQLTDEAGTVTEVLSQKLRSDRLGRQCPDVIYRQLRDHVPSCPIQVEALST
jgi:YD repeat-containing protein